MRILHVDDDDGVRRSVARYLTDCGFQVTSACDGELGLVAMRELDPFDVVLTDIRMPRMDGIEFMKQAREEFPEPAYGFLSGSISDAAKFLLANQDVVHFSKDERLAELVEALEAIKKAKGEKTDAQEHKLSPPQTNTANV